MSDTKSAVIVASTRTAIGSFAGSLKEIGAVDLEAIVIREALSRAGLEAFAAQSLAVLKDLDIDPARVNVNGGAMALLVRREG